MRRDSLRLFELIQLQGSVKFLDIQITVNVIVNEIQTIANTLLTHWMYLGNPECSCLNSNSSIHFLSIRPHSGSDKMFHDIR